VQNGTDVPRHNCDDRLVHAEPISTVVREMIRSFPAGLAPAAARYPTHEGARAGATAVLRDELVLRVMVVRNEVPPAFVEGVRTLR
jgi:hypothetical protein